MKPTKDSHWDKRHNFEVCYENDSFRNREVTYVNNAQEPKIKELTFMGYKDNALRIEVAFKTQDDLSRFKKLCKKEAWSRDCSKFDRGNSFYFDPKSQVELDGIVKLVNQFDALDEGILNELPFILNTRTDKHKDPSESYPSFESTMGRSESADPGDRALSYALAIDGSIPELKDFKQQMSASAKLHYTVEEFNKYYNQDDFALIAPYESGELPIQRDGYYLIAMYHSSEGTAYVNGTKHYQPDSRHFARQNNDLLFSHRRGGNGLPELRDSADQPILVPEQAKLFYTLEDYYYLDENNKRLPVFADYTFTGYLYVLVAANRLKNYSHESYRMLDEIDLKAQKSPQINDLLTLFKKEFFLYPPQPEFFSDAREKIADFYQRVLAVEQAELHEAGTSGAATTTTSYSSSHTFFSLVSDTTGDMAIEATPDGPVTWV